MVRSRMVKVHEFRLEWRGNAEWQQLVPVPFDVDGKELPMRRRTVRRFLKRLVKGVAFGASRLDPGSDQCDIGQGHLDTARTGGSNGGSAGRTPVTGRL